MFENMTKLEKRLSIAVGCLVPTFLLFVGFMWFLDKYQSNDMDIVNLESALTDAEELYDQAQYAKQRRRYYELTSLPADIDMAEVEFEKWLNDLITKKCGLKITARPEGVLTNLTMRGANGKQTIGKRVAYRRKLIGTLDQWVTLVDAYNRNVMFKRIESYRLQPLVVGGAGKNKLARTGKFQITAIFEFFSLNTAASERPLTELNLDTERNLAEYKELISNRNIFAPSNNRPSLKISAPSRQYADNDVSFTFSGEDDDEQDELSFSLVNFEGVDGAIDFEAGSRRAKFIAPPQEIGDYKLVVAVEDNGNPSKSSQKEITLNVIKKPNNQPALARDSRSFEVFEGESINFIVKAEDRDKDPVTMKLEETELPGATLTAATEENTAEFVCEPLPPGKYDFKIVLDDGKEPRMRNDEPQPTIATVRFEVMPPKFLDAQATAITSINITDKGERAFIHVRNKRDANNGDLIHKVLEGDSFELDRMNWIVKDISYDDRQITLQAAGKLKIYKLGDLLSEPRSESQVVSEETPDVETSEATSPTATDVHVETIDQ